jgi:hypothetical protein
VLEIIEVEYGFMPMIQDESGGIDKPKRSIRVTDRGKAKGLNR